LADHGRGDHREGEEVMSRLGSVGSHSAVVGAAWSEARRRLHRGDVAPGGFRMRGSRERGDVVAIGVGGHYPGPFDQWNRQLIGCGGEPLQPRRVPREARAIAISMRRHALDAPERIDREAALTGAITMLTKTALDLEADRGNPEAPLLATYGSLLCHASYAAAQNGNLG
jgi:hypothetical protein